MADITPDRLKALFRYDPETGEFSRLVSRGGWHKDRAAGRINTDGYRRLGIDGKQYAAHSLAWLYMTGSLPEALVDHINGDRADNRWANLRLATYSQNLANQKIKAANTSGFKGVSRIRASGRWLASIKVHGKSYNLGSFRTPEEAHQAYCRAAEKAFGEYARAA